MLKDPEKLLKAIMEKARVFAAGCKKVFVSVSGGVDSSVMVAVLCHSFRSENVVGLYRDIRSNPKHLKDVKLLQLVFGFKLIYINSNQMYDNFLVQVEEQFKKVGLTWADEGTKKADELGFSNAYASLKSRFTTPLAGFISKAIDHGQGRVFGTGNGEEDGLLRYFDKFGDGAVDINLLNGLTKAEVRQFARYLGVPERIVTKIPSADLKACGDDHNDEGELTYWAKKLGFNIQLSYGTSDGSQEGNIAWAWKEEIKRGVICGKNSLLTQADLTDKMGYTFEQTQVILFLRQVEKNTRHKVEPIPGFLRKELTRRGIVD